jgi:hypothetical protein
MITLPNPVRRLIGLEPIYGGKPRAPGWKVLAIAWLAENPRCAACGRTEDVVPHHVMPYHLYPELELDWRNLVTLCEWRTLNCHLWLGHAGNWSDWNPYVRTDAETFRQILETARAA